MRKNIPRVSLGDAPEPVADPAPQEVIYEEHDHSVNHIFDPMNSFMWVLKENEGTLVMIGLMGMSTIIMTYFISLARAMLLIPDSMWATVQGRVSWAL